MGGGGCFPFGNSAFAWFVSFAVQFERTDVRCYMLSRKSVKGCEKRVGRLAALRRNTAGSEEIDARVPRY